MDVHELNNIQVLKGVVADQFLSGGDLNLIVTAKAAESTRDRVLVSLELAEAGSPRLHYRCTATLSSRASRVASSSAQRDVPDAHTAESALLASASNLANNQIYGGALFHGPSFQVIKEISLNEGGQADVISIAGLRDQNWPAENWVADPAALDGALQLALLWTAQQLDLPSLPTSIETVHLMQPPKSGRYEASLHGRSTTANQAICDVILKDQEGNLAAELRGITTHALPPANRR